MIHARVKYISWALTFVFLGWLVWYVVQNYQQLLAALSFSPSLFACAALLFLLGVPVLALVNIILYKKFSVLLSFKEAMWIAVFNSLANMLPVSGGLWAKGLYLKKVHSLSYALYFSSLMALHVSLMGVQGLIGLLILLYYNMLSIGTVSPVLIVGFAGMSLLSIVLLSFPLDVVRWLPDKWRRLSKGFQEGWTCLKNDRILLLKLVGCQLCLIFLFALRFYVVFRLLSIDLSLSGAVLCSSSLILNRTISVLPGGVMVREILVGIISSLLGFDFGMSVLAVSLDRLIVIFVLSILNLFYLGFASGQWTKLSAGANHQGGMKK